MSAFRTSAAAELRAETVRRCQDELASIPASRWRAHAHRVGRVFAGRVLLVGCWVLAAFWHPNRAMSIGWPLLILMCAGMSYCAALWLAGSSFVRRLGSEESPAARLWRETDRLELQSRWLPLMAAATLGLLAAPWLLYQLRWSDFDWGPQEVQIWRTYSGWWLAPAVLIGHGTLLGFAWLRARNERRRHEIGGGLASGAGLAALAGSIAIAATGATVWLTLRLHPDFRAIPIDVFEKEWPYSLPIAAALLSGVPHLLLLERWLGRMAAEERAAFLEPAPVASARLETVARRRRGRTWAGGAACLAYAAIAVACAVDGAGAHPYTALKLAAIASVVAGYLAASAPLDQTSEGRLGRMETASLAWPLAGASLLIPSLIAVPVAASLLKLPEHEVASRVVLGFSCFGLLFLLLCLAPRPRLSLVRSLLAFGGTWFAIALWSEKLMPRLAGSIDRIAIVALSPLVLASVWLAWQQQQDRRILGMHAPQPGAMADAEAPRDG